MPPLTFTAKYSEGEEVFFLSTSKGIAAKGKVTAINVQHGPSVLPASVLDPNETIKTFIKYNIDGGYEQYEESLLHSSATDLLKAIFSDIPVPVK